MNALAAVKSSPPQQGAALVVSMVMLLVITVIGVAVMGGSRLEWLMANNSHLQTDAFRNAEIALAAGLASIATPPPVPASSTLLPQDLVNPSKWSDGTLPAMSVPTVSGTAAYVAEFITCSRYDPTTAPPLHYVDATCGGPTSFVVTYTYRVWALGTDGKGAVRLLQSVRTLLDNEVPGYTGLPNASLGPMWTYDNKAELPST